MKHYYKKLCLAFCMLFSMNALADETIGNLKYSFSGNNASVTGYNSENPPIDLVVPENVEFNGLTFTVTAINANALKNCNSLKSLITSEKITSIGSQSFYGCENLETIDVQGIIEASAFQSCTNLKKVKITGQIIRGSAFRGCSSLESLILVNIVDIYENAFSSCSNLKCIDFGYNIQRIGSGAFRNCTSLTYLVFPSSLKIICPTTYYNSDGGVWGYRHTPWGESSEWYYGQYGFDEDKYYMKDTYFAFLGCNYLQNVISAGKNTCSGFSNVNKYLGAESFVTWTQNDFEYSGKINSIAFTNNLPAGFEVTAYDMSALEKDAGTYTQNIPFTFTNDDMSFDVDIPYTYTVNPARLTAKVKNTARLYGDGNPEFTSTYTGFVNGEDASVLTSNGSYSTTATAKSDVGTYPIKQTGATAQNYVFDYEDGALTVNKAPLTMTANDKTMTYGGKVPTLDATYEGLKNNETVPVWTTEPTLTTTATPTSRVAQYPITISNAVAKNYDLTIHNGTLTIEKAALTAKVDNKSRLYGDANPQFTLTYTGLVNSETVPEWDQQPSFETVATTQSNVGNYFVSLKNAVAVNYEITPLDGTLTINKAPLKVTPKDVTRKYGEQNPPFELSYEGLKNSENQPEWTEEPVMTTIATQSSSVGEYSIEIRAAEARNYTLEKGYGKLSITKAPLTVKLLDATRKYGTANPNFEMSYTGLVNGETTPAWTTYPTITTTAGEKSDVGDYPITATGGILKNYETDSIAPGVLTITPASLVIRAQDASRYYFEENPKLDYVCTGFAEGDGPSLFTVQPQLTTTATMQSAVGIYPIEVGGAELKNYQLSYEKGQLTVNKRTLTVSTNDYTRAYGEENPEFELHYKGFVNNEDENVLVAKPKATTYADKNTNTGIYDITIGNGVAENYAFTYIGGKLTIEKAYQTLTWDQDLTGIKLYDQVELTATASSGLEVSYTLESNNVCSLLRIGNKQYLDCYGEGEAVIIAQQRGDINYWQSTKLYKTIYIGVNAGISQLEMQMDGSEQIFDTRGHRISKLQRGVNIIRMKDGTIKKIVVK